MPGAPTERTDSESEGINMNEWIVVDKFVNIEGVKIIELKCPHCGFRETHTSDIGPVRTCYVCGHYFPVRKDCQIMSSD